MKTRSSTLPARLVVARRRLERWRRRRNRPARIPEDLWALAVELAREHGLAPTARALRLDYYSLKKRLEGGGADRGASAARKVGPFVEVVASELLPPFAEFVVELEDAHGVRMRIQVKGGGVPDLSTLVRAFRPEAS